MTNFDVIVVGGGHAGTEAASAASRMGASTCLVSIDKSKIGEMSCNPAIGGLGKGHIVKEIDAMGGVMGYAADQAGIQFRLLNRRKGPAVQGPRAQADRDLYRSAVQDRLFAQSCLQVKEAEVVDLLVNGTEVDGVLLSDGEALRAGSIVITSGTFLRGIIHRGDDRFAAGRIGERPANALGKRLEGLNFSMGRLKTGTPPRVDRNSINWNVLPEQPGDEEPVFFSYNTPAVVTDQVCCHITRTNSGTHKWIRDNIHRAPIFSGSIEALGPRYCPSIEDKVVRFGERDGHQIFLEPEGLNSNLVYPNGISTSLPIDVQDGFIRTIEGLENAVIAEYGYAIEYDFVDPRELYPSLETKKLRNLFLAGQINGTTGYEEAAGQGLAAGINAARNADAQNAIEFTRKESYIGVMIDDLVTQGVREPYRMFTSRAEFRLSLRADNADQRLTDKAIDLGLIDSEQEQAHRSKMQTLVSQKSALKSLSITPAEASRSGVALNQDGKRRSAWELLSYPEIDFELICRLFPEVKIPSASIVDQLSIDAKYDVYLDRQAFDVDRLNLEEELRIPPDFQYSGLSGLSIELQQKLSQVKPTTLGQAGRIQGVTPSALLLIASLLKGQGKRAS